MAKVETPNGTKVIRETKTFNQVQTENKLAKKAGVVETTICGQPIVPTSMPSKPKEQPLTKLEKVNG